MQYKGYTGSIHYSDEDSLFFGHVLGIRSVISYEGETIPELFADFKAGVNDYLDLCKAHGWKADIPSISHEIHHAPDISNLYYMDHTGSIEYDEYFQMYHGKLTDIKGICEYSGMDLEQLKEDFKKAVDEYNGMMDHLYFELMGPGFRGIHKLLVDWFEEQDRDTDDAHPFVFRDANMLRRDDKKVYSVDEIRELLLPVFMRYNIKEAYLLGDYCTGSANGNSSIEILWDGGDLDFLSFIHEASTVLAKNVMMNHPRKSEWCRLDTEPSILLYLKKEQ